MSLMNSVVHVRTSFRVSLACTRGKHDRPRSNPKTGIAYRDVSVQGRVCTVTSLRRNECRSANKDYPALRWSEPMITPEMLQAQGRNKWMLRARCYEYANFVIVYNICSAVDSCCSESEQIGWFPIYLTMIILLHRINIKETNKVIMNDK
jgi:hypothetical protein